MSNTSIGRGSKGSKFWIQTLVNLDNGNALTKAISEEDKTIVEIQWLSPLTKSNYEEYKLNFVDVYKELNIKGEDFDFWPNNQPQWDAIGKAGDTIILVEAKAHTSETISKLSATSQESINLITKSMKETYNKLSSTSDFSIWINTYYQLGNRLTFLEKLKSKGYQAKLVLLNIVNDPTYIKTTHKEWEDYNTKVFTEMLGGLKAPTDVIVVNFQV